MYVYFIHACEGQKRMSDLKPLLQLNVSHHVSTGCQTWVFCMSNEYSLQSLPRVCDIPIPSSMILLCSNSCDIKHVVLKGSPLRNGTL